MNWKDTVLKQKAIKWKLSPIKYVDDGSMDLIINVPLTNLLFQQARWSFICGIQQALLVFANAQKEGRLIDDALLTAKFAEWGLADIWKRIQRTTEEGEPLSQDDLLKALNGQKTGISP